MQDTLDSVNQNGVVVPAIIRPRAEGSYAIVTRHRRKLASEQSGFMDIPGVAISQTTRPSSNLRITTPTRRYFPGEKAKAYKIKLDAIKRQGERTDYLFLKQPLFKIIKI